MKLCRIGAVGNERPGVIVDGVRVDVSTFGGDYDEAFFGGGALSRLEEWLKSNLGACPRVAEEERHAPALCRPSKIICVGLNYKQHAIETGATLPSEPVIFFKATSALCGPFDNLVLPRNSKKTDWEVELGVVIGKLARYVSEEKAREHVAGYVLHNDYSERAFQLEHEGQWVKGKSADSFAPIGPFMATRDEVDDTKLGLWLKLNGQVMQSSNTADMAFGVPKLVSYISQFMTLLPGDIVSTGTPSGVGLGLNPPVYLKPGDRVQSGIDGLGDATQVVVALES